MLDNIFQKYLTVKNIIFFIAAILFIILIIKVQDIVLMFFASYVIACSLKPFSDRLSTKLNKNLAAILVLLAAIVVILLFVVPIFVITGYEIGHFTEAFPQHLDGIKDSLSALPFINKSGTAQVDIGALFSSASGTSKQVFTDIIDFGKNIGSGIVYLITSIMLMYYFMVDNETLKNGWLKLFPSHIRKKANSIMDTITEKVGGYVIAQVITMASVGLIMTLGLLILKVDYAIILGLITAVLDIIPIVGPGLALIICLVGCYKSGPVILGLVTLVFVIAQLSENTFVRPLVFGKLLNIHPVIIYLFLFLSAKYLGVIGVIFAPAIAATTLVLIEELYIKNLE